MLGWILEWTFTVGSNKWFFFSKWWVVIRYNEGQFVNRCEYKIIKSNLKKLRQVLGGPNIFSFPFPIFVFVVEFSFSTSLTLPLIKNHALKIVAKVYSHCIRLAFNKVQLFPIFAIFMLCCGGYDITWFSVKRKLYFVQRKWMNLKLSFSVRKERL